MMTGERPVKVMMAGWGPHLGRQQQKPPSDQPFLKDEVDGIPENAEVDYHNHKRTHSAVRIYLPYRWWFERFLLLFLVFLGK